MRDEALNESLKAVINRTTHASLNEAVNQKLQPITRIFTRFLKSQVLPYLKEQTGIEWTLSDYKQTLGAWDTSIKYRAYARDAQNDPFDIEWDVTARDGGKFDLRISGSKNRRNVAYAIYHDSSALNASDFKVVKKIVPDQIVSGFKEAMSGSYTQEIDAIKKYRQELVDDLKKLTDEVNKFVALVDKGLKMKDPRKGLAAQQATLSRMHYNMSGRGIESNARYISETIDVIASGK
jgi:hypothetical protein